MKTKIKIDTLIDEVTRKEGKILYQAHLESRINKKVVANMVDKQFYEFWKSYLRNVERGESLRSKQSYIAFMESEVFNK